VGAGAMEIWRDGVIIFTWEHSRFLPGKGDFYLCGPKDL
jgi:hypothetical protein